MVKITSTPSYYRESFRNKGEPSTFIFEDIFQNSLVFSIPHCFPCSASIFAVYNILKFYYVLFAGTSDLPYYSPREPVSTLK